MIIDRDFKKRIPSGSRLPIHAISPEIPTAVPCRGAPWLRRSSTSVTSVPSAQDDAGGEGAVVWFGFAW